MKKTVSFRILGNNSIEIEFQYDKFVADMVKSIPGRKYLPEKRVWIIPKTKNFRSAISKYFDNTVILEFKEDQPVKTVPDEYMNELNLRRYSKN
ncbi:MAG: hypothetical protein U9N32_07000, partial [Spirochaetota bacterium]|nr:hypothetical protein [Spirochaetota bacterium]